MKKQFPVRACLAEVIGTFLLAAGVAETIAVPSLGVPTVIAAGLILGTMVYTIGSVSGAHINPAVTLSLLSVGKIKAYDALAYILSQIVGGYLAYAYQVHHYPLTLPTAITNYPLVAICEMLGAFILVWGVSSVVHKKVDAAASGIVIGASLTLGAMFAAMGSFGIVNPAVAIGLGVFSPVYLLAPIVGGILSAQLYRWIVSEK